MPKLKRTRFLMEAPETSIYGTPIELFKRLLFRIDLKKIVNKISSFN